MCAGRRCQLHPMKPEGKVPQDLNLLQFLVACTQLYVTMSVGPSVCPLVSPTVHHTLLHTTTLKVCWKVSSAASDVARRQGSTRSELTELIFSRMHVTIHHYNSLSVAHSLTCRDPEGVLEGVVSCFRCS